MVISVNENTYKCDTYEEYETCIDKAIQEENAEIWISKSGSQDDLPCMSIVLGGGLDENNTWKDKDGKLFFPYQVLSAVFKRYYLDEVKELREKNKLEYHGSSEIYGMIMTSTQVDEDAQHFYRKLGYKECGGLTIDIPGYEQPMEMFMSKGL